MNDITILRISSQAQDIDPWFFWALGEPFHQWQMMPVEACKLYKYAYIGSSSNLQAEDPAQPPHLEEEYGNLW